jgi:hypothetical protein
VSTKNSAPIKSASVRWPMPTTTSTVPYRAPSSPQGEGLFGPMRTRGSQGEAYKDAIDD